MVVMDVDTIYFPTIDNSLKSINKFVLKLLV